MTDYMIFYLGGGMDPQPSFYLDAPIEASSPKQAIKKAIRQKEGRKSDLVKAKWSEEQDFLAIPYSHWNVYHDKSMW